MNRSSEPRRKGWDEFNRNHPELQDGEVFLGNGNPPLDKSVYPYPSARLGRTSYNADGTPVHPDKGWRPVFAQLADLEAEAVANVRETFGRTR